MPNTNSWETAGKEWIGPIYGPQTKLFTPEDPEFVAKVKGAIGPRFETAVDPSKANAVMDRIPPSLAGFYILPNASHEEIRRQEQLKSMRGMLRPDNVYAFPFDQDKGTWSHEFRHRAGVYDETTNRMMDAYYADSPSLWATAKEAWLDASREYHPKITQALSNARLIQLLLSEDYFGEGQSAREFEAKSGIGSKKFWKGMFDNQYSTAYDKTIAPWKIWAQKEGYLDEKLKPTKALKAMFKSLDKFYENTDKGKK